VAEAYTFLSSGYVLLCTDISNHSLMLFLLWKKGLHKLSVVSSQKKSTLTVETVGEASQKAAAGSKR
jgi:hypothetical protein